MGWGNKIMTPEMVIICALMLLGWLLARIKAHEAHELMIENIANRRMIDDLQSDIIDLGVQLYNLNPQVNTKDVGYVYVVKSDSGHYKIGKTTDPHNRAKTFNVKLPMEIDFLALIKSGNHTLLENHLHRQYRHKRVNGEWFNASETDLIFLRNYPGNCIKSTVNNVQRQYRSSQNGVSE